MQTKELYLSDLKFNIETWRIELRFHFKEMDTFQEKLEEIAGRENNKNALKRLEVFQNRIMIEKDAISKLLHRIRNKIASIKQSENGQSVYGHLQKEEHSLREDMKTYFKLHYELKEEMMDYFLEWLL